MVKRTGEFEPNQKDVPTGGYTSSDQDLMNKGMITKVKLQPKIREQEKPDNVKKFELIGAEKALLYARKNADYGDSFNVSIDKYGLKAVEMRLQDKFMRFCQLIENPAQVTEEKLRETLMDMSNYCDMTIMRLDDDEEKKAMARMKEIEQHNKWMKENIVNKPIVNPLAKKHNDALDAAAYAVARAGADWDGDIVGGKYVNIKEGVIGEAPYPTCGDEVVKPTDGKHDIHVHIHTNEKLTVEKLNSMVMESMRNIGSPM